MFLDIVTYIIIALAVAWAIWKMFKFFKTSNESCSFCGVKKCPLKDIKVRKVYK